jgi:hypothetical protein
MQTVIPLRIKDGWISLNQSMLPDVWLNEPIEAILKDYGILIKPKAWSEKTRGIVGRNLSYGDLDDLYGQR